MNALLKHPDFNAISGGSNCSESALFWSGFGVSVAFPRRAHFGHVSGISDIVPAIWSIPQCFSRGGERLGEGLISRSFQKKSGGWEGCRLDCWTLRKNVAKALHVLGERVEREWI